MLHTFKLYQNGSRLPLSLLYKSQRSQASLLAPSARYFCAAKAAPSLATHEQASEEESSRISQATEQTSRDSSSNLRFVDNESNLRQVFLRGPDDGLFPIIKHVDEMEADDVEILINANLKDILKKLIEREKLDDKLTHELIGQLHDKDGRMIERIYERLLKERLTKEECTGNFMPAIQYNMMMQSAAIYKRHRLLAQLMLESTVLGVTIDTQTYVKTIIATHYDKQKTVAPVEKSSLKAASSAGRPWGKDNLAYLYALFENDVPREDYALASVILQEYVSTVTADQFDNPKGTSGPQKRSSSSKGEKRKKRSSKDKSSSRSKRNSQDEVDWKSFDPWTLAQVNSQAQIKGDSITPPIDLSSHGNYQQQIVMTPDQFEYDELLQNLPPQESHESNKKRHSLYKSRMAELQQYSKLLNKPNTRGEGKSGKQGKQSSKHIDKYRHKQNHKSEEIHEKLTAAQMAQKESQEETVVDDLDPVMQKQIDKMARAMVTKIYKEMIAEEKHLASIGNDDGGMSPASFTLQKFYEQNSKEKLEQEAKSSEQQQQTGSEDLELTTGFSSALPKREPVQSSEELDDNTEMEQAKEALRNELTSASGQEENEAAKASADEEKVSSGDDDTKK